MIKTILLPFKFFLFNISRKINHPLIFPVSYTYSITSKCDSMCRTCNIWKHQEGKELSTSTWRKIIADIGNKPYWITITGGNQFLREDFTKIIYYIKKYNKPVIINIPVSATIPNIILNKVSKVLRFLGNTKLILNVSLDGLKDTHENIRGKDKSYDNTLLTIKKLKKLQRSHSNLIIGTYTVISKHNINEIKKIKDLINKEVKPDHYGFELAEFRSEYKNFDEDFSISKSDAIRILKMLEPKNKSKNLVLRMKNHIRKKYNNYILRMLSGNKKIMPCYAGITSIEISPRGEVWECANKTSMLGDLTKNNFRHVFFSKSAQKIRKRIKKENCYCTHSNPFYTNYMSELMSK